MRATSFRRALSCTQITSKYSHDIDRCVYTDHYAVSSAAKKPCILTRPSSSQNDSSIQHIQHTRNHLQNFPTFEMIVPLVTATVAVQASTSPSPSSPRSSAL